MILQDIKSDIVFSFRTLRRNPTFAIAAIITLAVGIAINTSVFAVFNAVALRPLPVRNPEEIVDFNQSFRGEFSRTVIGSRNRFSYPEYLAYSKLGDLFSGALAYVEVGLTLSGDQPEPVKGVLVTANYFPVLGATLSLGRPFSTQEAETGAPARVVVLRHGFWQRRFGGAPDIIGKEVTINGTLFAIVGVTDPDFVGVDAVPPDMWIPLTMHESLMGKGQLMSLPNAGWLHMLARLKPGVSVGRAAQGVQTVARQMDLDYPGRITDIDVFKASLGGGSDTSNKIGNILLLSGLAASLMLLMTCANVANLVLARGANRMKEIAIRRSLGAGRGRLVRQLIFEGLLLGLTGGIFGLILALWIAKVFVRASPVGPVVVDLSPDLMLFGYTALVSGISGLAVGIIPALRATDFDLNSVLKQNQPALQRVGSVGQQGSLLALQIATSFILLIGVGLLVRQLSTLQRLDLGFDRNNLLIAGCGLVEPQYNATRAAVFQHQVVESLANRPGIVSVSLALIPPLQGEKITQISLPGRYSNEMGQVQVDSNIVAANYFQTMGLPMLSGRTFEPSERDGVAIISESMARAFWEGQGAVGKVFHADKDLMVVGVVHDVLSSFSDRPRLCFYVPASSEDWSGLKILIRTNGDKASVQSALREIVRTLDSSVLVTSRSLAETVESELAPAETAATLSIVMGLLAVMLASVGIYAVVSYWVSQRIRDIGIRTALGAQPRDVFRLVLRAGLRPMIIGYGIGLAGSFGATNVFHRFLFGISAHDPITFIGVSALLTTVAAAALFIPARRAIKIDPATALRCE